MKFLYQGRNLWRTQRSCTLFSEFSMSRSLFLKFALNSCKNLDYIPIAPLLLWLSRYAPLLYHYVFLRMTIYYISIKQMSIWSTTEKEKKKLMSNIVLFPSTKNRTGWYSQKYNCHASIVLISIVAYKSFFSFFDHW